MSLPEGDRYSKSKSKLLAELTMAMGGRVAEEIIFGPDKVSNGAAGDIKMATDQARRMITEWGMSDKLGMISYGDNSQEVFLGHSVTQNKNVSEETAREIDGEIKDIIGRAYAKAKRILTENIEELHRARARPAGARDAVGRRNPHRAARRAGDPQGRRRAGAGKPPRLGPHHGPSCHAARRRPGSGAAAGLSPMSSSPSGASWAGIDLSRPCVMGVLNVTPDSFSDGGDHADADAAIAAGRAMLAAGAAVVDVGGESSRPGSAGTPPEVEQARILPVIRALAGAGACVSVDTRHAATMRAALDAGARIVNDITGLAFDPDARGVVARAGCAVVLMHMRGTPDTMHGFAHYDDVVAEVARRAGRPPVGGDPRGYRGGPDRRSTPASALPRPASRTLSCCAACRRCATWAGRCWWACPANASSAASAAWRNRATGWPDRWRRACSRWRGVRRSCASTTCRQPCRRCACGRRSGPMTVRGELR